jgi:O-antigen/teichoic acid export membrane protein
MIRRIREEWARGKHFVVFSGLKIVAQALFAVLPFVLALYLEPKGFGIYSLSMMVVYLFSGLLVYSAGESFVLYSNKALKDKKPINKVFTAYIAFLFCSTVFFLLLAVLISDPVSRFSSLSDGQFPFLIAAYFGMGIRYAGESLYLALDKRQLHAVYQILIGTFYILGIFTMQLLSKLTLVNVFILLLVAPILALICLLPFSPIKLLLPLSYDKIVFQKLFRYTTWSMLGGVAVYLISWGDNFVLRYFVSLEEIGVYNLSYQIFKGVSMVIFIVPTYFLPFVSQNIKNKEKISSYLNNKRPILMGAGLVGIATVYFLTPFVLSFYGEAYADSVAVAQFLLIGTVFMLYKNFFGPIMVALEKYKFGTQAIVLSATVNIILDFVFVPYMGIMGAALATTITYALIAGYVWVYFHMVCKKEIFA